ncbi:MAG: hypothetical protein RB148_07275 [Armatimonadota bacterium]|nr:hypothetical protein [Armatimonadota bacterium]
MRVYLSVVLLMTAVFALPPVARSQDPVAAARAQLTTARFHAGELAQRGAAVAATQLHLRHVVNCLEGPQGKNFTAAAGHPCQGQGSGAIVDLRAASASGHTGAGRALTFASAGLTVVLQGLASTDVNEAQPFAAVVARQMDAALSALGR